MANTHVKVFHSGMASAPLGPNTSTRGLVIDLLDACLVNGWASQTPTSIIVDATGNAVVTLSGANPFEPNTTIEVSGATESDLNGQWQVTARSSAPSTCTFKCNLSNITATGTITVKLPGAGWTKAFSATDRAVYTSPECTAAYIISEEASLCGVKSFYVAAAEKAHDAFTFSGLMEVDNRWIGKCHSSYNSEWFVIASNRAVHIGLAYSTQHAYSASFWGDIESYKPADYYCAYIAGQSGSSATQIDYSVRAGDTSYSETVTTDGRGGILKSYMGLGSWCRATHGIKYFTGVPSYTLVKYAGPEPVTGEYEMSRMYVFECPVLVKRGHIPGLFVPLYYAAVPTTPNMIRRISQYTVCTMDNVTSTYAQVPIVIGNSITSYIYIDVTGPWHTHAIN